MASRSKKKTTMAKLNRENKLRERRLDKKAKKDARKLAASGDQGMAMAEVADGADVTDGAEVADAAEVANAAPAAEPVVP